MPCIAILPSITNNTLRYPYNPGRWLVVRPERTFNQHIMYVRRCKTPLPYKILLSIPLTQQPQPALHAKDTPS